MRNKLLSRSHVDAPPTEYRPTMADLERPTFRGEVSLRQVRREIFALCERLGAQASLVMQWAARLH